MLWYWLYIICVEYVLIVLNEFKDSLNWKCLDRVKRGIMNVILICLRVVFKVFGSDVMLDVVWYFRDCIVVLMIKFIY